MKKIIAMMLMCILMITGCSPKTINVKENYTENTSIEEIVEYKELNDPKLLQHIEDCIHTYLVDSLNSDDYTIEDISTAYISKEYLDEIEYNSMENLYFGYSLYDIDTQFEGTKYVFSLGEDGATIVREVEKYENVFGQVIKDVLIGTGVILVCVTITVFTKGIGASTISSVFATSSKVGTVTAVSSGAIGGVSAGIVEYYQTGDVDAAIEAAAVSGSSGFKWGAITGAIAGGVEKAIKIHKTTPTFRESEIRANNKYPGETQVSFKDGKRVPMSVENATRPDIVRYKDGVLEAIEVKNYNLNNPNSRNALYREVKRQVTDRVKNLPSGSTQRIVLDVKGRGYSKELLDDVINNLKSSCSDVYVDLPIDIMK